LTRLVPIDDQYRNGLHGQVIAGLVVHVFWQHKLDVTLGGATTAQQPVLDRVALAAREQPLGTALLEHAVAELRDALVR
jgi:hypothetical protein